MAKILITSDDANINPILIDTSKYHLISRIPHSPKSNLLSESDFQYDVLTGVNEIIQTERNKQRA